MKRTNKKEIIKKLKECFYRGIKQEFKKLEGQVCYEVLNIKKGDLTLFSEEKKIYQVVNIRIQRLLEQTLGFCESLSIQIEAVMRHRRQKENIRCPFTMDLKGLEESDLT